MSVSPFPIFSSMSFAQHETIPESASKQTGHSVKHSLEKKGDCTNSTLEIIFVVLTHKFPGLVNNSLVLAVSMYLKQFTLLCQVHKLLGVLTR